MSRLPDRTGILVSPLTTLLAGSIFSALLVSAATQKADPYAGVMLQMLDALGKSLGVVASSAVAAVLTVSSAVWFVVRYRYYRTRVADDRRRAGMT